MNQILNFNISIYDVRTKTSVKIKDDSRIVQSIKIQKNISLDNKAIITFAKSKSYKLIGIEEQIKLYNYVKIELTLKNRNTGSKDQETKFYFSGFIQNVNKNVVYGNAPAASVSITVVDFANLFKTTFYTKNLTFVQILQQAVPEFRLINFEEIFNDPQNRLLNGFYSLNQLGFIFFSFFFFKFFYSIVYESPGVDKKAGEETIFKKFKLFMPFGFDVTKDSENKIYSMFKNQVSSLNIYKQLQGVALDLFKYVYPEPIFEFTTHETKESVIFQIRLTPFMSFSRNMSSEAIKLQYGKDQGFDPDSMSYATREVKIEGAINNNIDDYKVIDEKDFGHKQIKEMFSETKATTVSENIISHLDPIIKLMNETLLESRKLNVRDFIPDKNETSVLINSYFNEIEFDIRLVESMNMSRSAQNVVNVVWTVPTTDTAMIQSSGRALVYGLLQKTLNEMGGGDDQFSRYIATQFVEKENKNPNPAFFWNYRNMYPDKYVSGDLNFFGFREFEIKWNCLTIYDSYVYSILNYVDKKVLEEIRDDNNDEKFKQMRKNAIANNVQTIDKKTSGSSKVMNNSSPMKKIGIFYEKAFDNPDFKASASRLGISLDELKRMKSTDVASFILKVKDISSGSIGEFAAKLNGIIARAYRENEHLYDCNISTPINLSLLPGMIVKSVYPNSAYNSPRFKGYVTGITHNIDFNSASMKSTFTINRAAMDDSGVYVK